LTVNDFHPWLALVAVLLGAPTAWVMVRFLFSTPEDDVEDLSRDLPWFLFGDWHAYSSSWLMLKIAALVFSTIAVIVFWYKVLVAVLEWL